MNKPTLFGISRRAACRRLLGLAGGVPFAMSWLENMRPAIADGWGNVHRVEEDWYVKIGTPEPEQDSPQITTVMSPAWTLSSSYGVFDMNCATQPGFASGGVQLQLWYNGSITQTCSNSNWASLSNANEEIHYTTSMMIQDGYIVYEILNGSGTTWGTFGTGELKLQRPTVRNNLNGYSPYFSAYNSRIGFASHRVRDFILQRVRYISDTGNVEEDALDYVLHHYEPA